MRKENTFVLSGKVASSCKEEEEEGAEWDLEMDDADYI